MSVFSKSDLDTDKSNDYLQVYRRIFEPLKNQDINIFELGVLKGGSLSLWKNYFQKGRIVGLDINFVEVEQDPRIRFYQGNQSDINLLKKITSENTKDGFSIIIDDASHFGYETFTSFIYLFKNSLKSGGIYIIEDWCTGYWPHYPDGRNLVIDEQHLSFHLHKDTDYKFKRRVIGYKKKQFRSHNYGMVGVVKQLIDEVGLDDATTPNYTSAKIQISSLIEGVEFRKGQVVIYKK